MKITLSLAFLLAASHSSSTFFHTPLFADVDTEDVENDRLNVFQQWATAFDKRYSDAERDARFEQFKLNWRAIHLFNEAGEHGVQLALNQFADLSTDEFQQGSCIRRDRNIETVPFTRSSNAVPSEVDWVAKNKVSPVKNQGRCGSCWAFSTTGALESAFAIALDSDVVSLSEQQLVDCSTSYGNNGCNGGIMQKGFAYVKDKGGLCREGDYPYEANDGTCRSSSCALYTAAKVTSVVSVPKDDVSALKEAVARQPVSVAIEADTFVFQHYHSGVLTSRLCGTTLDHGVLIVGYGTDSQNGQDVGYWKIKNSWGETWGENGYIRICTDCAGTGDGQCGINEDGSFPVVEKHVQSVM